MYDVAVKDIELLGYMTDKKIRPIEDIGELTEKTEDIKVREALLEYSHS